MFDGRPRNSLISKSDAVRGGLSDSGQSASLEVQVMCLTCGCMDAHLEMGESNITYEDLKRAADENGRSVAETLEIVERTRAKDSAAHPEEYTGPAAATS